MGAILAMNVLTYLRPFAAVCMMMAVTACSSSGTTPMVDTFRTLGTQMTKEEGTVRDARAVLTPEIVAAAQQPYLLVEIPSRQASATRSVFNQKGPIQDWRGADGISLILHNDVLVGTRGLGADLFAADPVPSHALRSVPAAPYTRVFRYLDAENRHFVVSYRCTTAAGGDAQVDLIARQVSTSRVIETCQTHPAEDKPIVNEYWIGSDYKAVWKSRQWVSESVAYATFYHLVR